MESQRVGSRRGDVLWWGVERGVAEGVTDDRSLDISMLGKRKVGFLKAGGRKGMYDGDEQQR